MRTPITYYGGKQTLLKYILPLIPPHKRYTEAFCGGCAVLFAKEPSKCEVINDLNGELIQFYRVLKTDFPVLKARVDGTIHSRDSHAHAGHILAYPHFYSPVDIAWAVWMRSKSSYASKLDGSFGYDFSGGMPKRLHNAKKDFTRELSERLDGVTIEARDALQVIKCYDSEETFHFIDPPYVNSNCGHYDGMFSDADLNDLLSLISTIKGKFMLTMYPYDKILTFANEHHWHIHSVERRISSSRTTRRIQTDWIVTNY